MQVRRLGVIDYPEALARMRGFNARRLADTEDELWVLEHPPVFTRGVSCKSVPHRNPLDIPVVDSDRGGQITYHGPGQLVLYLMFDIRRGGRGVRHLVREIEQAVIDMLSDLDIEASRKERAPGVYVDGRKIAALGLRVRNGCTFHGLSVNIDMDLTPFGWIDPCGYAGLETVNVADLTNGWDREAIIENLVARLGRILPPAPLAATVTV